jgi:hypothetical protein
MNEAFKIEPSSAPTTSSSNQAKRTWEVPSINELTVHATQAGGVNNGDGIGTFIS